MASFKREGTRRKPRATDVVIHENAVGGPRIVSRDEQVSLTRDNSVGIGDTQPRFSVVSRNEAQRRGFRPPSREALKRAEQVKAGRMLPIGFTGDAILQDYVTRQLGEHEPKRKGWPTLADQVLAQAKSISGFNGHELRPPVRGFTTLSQGMRRAEKFVIDRVACESLHARFLAAPAQIMDHPVRWPHECTWIEYPMELLGMGGERMDQMRMGWFILNGMVLTIMGSDAGCMVMDLAYNLNAPQTSTPLERWGFTREQLANRVWGTDIRALIGERANDVLDQHGFVQVADPVRGEQGTMQLHDFPMMLMTLQALTEPAVVEYRQVEGIRRASHRGTVRTQNHSIVTLHLERSTLRYEGGAPTGTGTTPGWHTVRGHWVRDRKAIQAERGGSCAHGDTGGTWWVETSAGRQQCLGCDGHRTWRELPNGRGDRSRPVSHHYEVKE